MMGGWVTTDGLAGGRVMGSRGTEPPVRRYGQVSRRARGDALREAERNPLGA
jgi:hypothetical protein